MECQMNAAIFLGIMTKPVGEIILRLSFMAVFHPKLHSLKFCLLQMLFVKCDYSVSES